MGEILLQKSYNWEEIISAVEDVEWSIEGSNLPGEFPGKIRVTVEHIPCEFCETRKMINICPECERDYAQEAKDQARKRR